MKIFIPDEVNFIIDKFYENNFEAFIVGGCVRDSILGIEPKDFDITTSAKPEDTISLFEKTIPTGIKHGTITVRVTNNSYEVTTFRTDGTYIDNRRPSCVEFVSDIKEDLSRRDFTINALAYNNSKFIDYFDGVSDIKNRIIRCVGEADKRFKEDALRMLRAVRFSCQLNFKIEDKTLNAIRENSSLIQNISKERIRDELCKILISNNAHLGIDLLEKCGLLKFILPKIQALVNYTPISIKHNRNVFSHTLKVIENTKNNNLLLRVAALFHDVGKLETLALREDGIYYFPNHSNVGAVMSYDILRDLRFDNKSIDIICKLIKNHLILKPFDMMTRYEAKKLLNHIGKDYIKLLFDLQRADTNSLDSPTIFLEKVNFTEKLIDDIIFSNEPLSLKDLNITGQDLIKHCNLKQGKVLGETLNFLLDEVLKDSSLNNREILLNLANNKLNL